MGVNGSGMHTNLSIFNKNKNLFYDKKGKGQLSDFAWKFIERILSKANDICLIFNSSVNSYRRLDPHFEAPNEIKVSEIDRGAMIRVPLFNERSARIEVRSVAPDSNPYLLILTLIKTGLETKLEKTSQDKRPRARFLPGNINTAISHFRQSDFIGKILGEEMKEKFTNLKQAVANRSPSDLGIKIKNSEIIYHHEVYNQMLWNDF